MSGYQIRRDDSVQDMDKILLQRQIDDLRVEFSEHRVQESDRWDRMLSITEENATAINLVAVSLKELTADTKEIVQLHKDIQGAARIGSGLQRFILWCLKWGGIIGTLGAAIHYITEYLSKH